MKRFYEIIYRYFHAPWDIGPRDELVRLVESGSLQPCRAIDLGCGAGANSIYLAQHGFEVTGVDFATAALQKARLRAEAAGVQVSFVCDDLTNLCQVRGQFDFLLDYGVLDDLRLPQRELYLKNILSLTHPGSQFLLWGFEYPMRWWEKYIPFYDIPFQAGEIEARFGKYFDIQKIAGQVNWSTWPPGYAAYWLVRNVENQ